jgi:release factor glutamine methyltransferase
MNETITYIRKSLETLYPPEEVRSLTDRIVEKVCNLSRTQQILCKDKQLSYTEKESVRMIVHRLQQSEPIQYIFGETEFYGLPFEVSPAVLIPRPETEELVHRIVQEFKDDVFFKKTVSPVSSFSSVSPKILDVGTGSGCIAISLAKKLTNMQVYALDISKEALQIAQRNATRNNVIIQCTQADILSTDIQKDTSFPRFDLIVSNPPYVTESERAAMKCNVLDYEPHQALFVPDDDPILFYRRIAEFSLDKLIENGLLYFEINALYGEIISRMLHQKGFRNIELSCDLSGKERFIKAIK